jgi:pterin-4a-carbinolamine dehydratase
MSVAFINYRRTDSQHAAQGLYTQLRIRFGPTRVFLDVGSIHPGSLWPERLRSGLDKSTVLLSVIGPHWLTAANQYGQRRLDDENDWVRNELSYALTHQKPIIPILVADGSLPPPEALPEDIKGVLTHQSMQLRDDKWDHDLAELVELLGTEHGFVDNQTSVVMPSREVTITPLNATELEDALSQLRGWEIVESMIPRDYPKPRQELRKVYRFRSFKAAVGFMNDAVPKINELKHHPRWENQWRSVTVYLSTWDIGNRISALDVDIAMQLDELYSNE